MKMKTFTLCLDAETFDRLEAASAACGVPRGHVAREVLRATFGVPNPVGRIFSARPSVSMAGNRDAPWLNRGGQGDHG